MDWYTFWVELFVAVFTVTIPIIANGLLKYFDYISSDIQNEETRFYIDKAVNIIHDIVIEINQTYVDSLKKKGEFTYEAQQVAKQTAIAKANQMICEEAKEAVADMYGDFNRFLQTKIESFVNEEKKV